jgi:hypothetical protein
MGDTATIPDVGPDTNGSDVKDSEAEDAVDGCPACAACGTSGAACCPGEICGAGLICTGGFCDCDPTTASDFYVGPSGDAGACNTFSTIPAALLAARSSTAAQRTVHLAAGTYLDVTDFPIDLRGGISLAGAGKYSSILVGSGLAPTLSPPANAWTQLSDSANVYATILVGDATKTSRISGMSIRPGSNMFAGTEAIVCDRGNATTTPPSPNTLVSNVEIGAFEEGVRVTWSSSPLAGCNLSLTSSLVHDGWFGVVADGHEADTTAARQTVSVQVGDLTAGDGNAFVNLGIPDGSASHGRLSLSGAGLATCDAVTGVVVEGNRFYQTSGEGDLGVWAVHRGSYESPGFDIESNEFGPLTNGGVFLSVPIVVDRLLNNSFHDISMLPGYGFSAGALGLGGDIVNMPSLLPVVVRARGNTFFANDVGVTIRSWDSFPVVAWPASMIPDFGTATDPGNNTFRCNSAAAIGLPGGDVYIDVRSALQPAVALPFEGNTWDHAPPTTTVGPYTSEAVGTDVFVLADDAGAPFGVVVDTADASAASTPPCPAGRVAGP